MPLTLTHRAIALSVSDNPTLGAPSPMEQQLDLEQLKQGTDAKRN